MRVIDLNDAPFLSAKFGRQFVLGWKVCPTCTQIINDSMDVDSKNSREENLIQLEEVLKLCGHYNFQTHESKLNLLQKLEKEKKSRLTKKGNNWF